MADSNRGEVVGGVGGAINSDLLQLCESRDQGGSSKDIIHELFGKVGTLAEVRPRGNVLAVVVCYVGEEGVQSVKAAE